MLEEDIIVANIQLLFVDVKVVDLVVVVMMVMMTMVGRDVVVVWRVQIWVESLIVIDLGS